MPGFRLRDMINRRDEIENRIVAIECSLSRSARCLQDLSNLSQTQGIANLRDKLAAQARDFCVELDLLHMESGRDHGHR